MRVSVQSPVQEMRTVAVAARDTLARLHESREVDWRFLLPDPRPRQVVYLGSPSDSLAGSLERFSESLVCMDSPREGQVEAGTFDLAVADCPSSETLQIASRAVRAGGYMFAMYSKKKSPSHASHVAPPQDNRRSNNAPCRVADCVAAIQRQGFRRVRAYWHWPDFAACAEIVPLDEPRALRQFFHRRRGSTTARLKARLGRILLRLGQVDRLVHSFSLVAEKAAS